MGAQAVSANAAIKFHVSLHAANLERSVDFFRVLFACEPAKLRRDYAKFELDEPPLVLSLIAGPHAASGTLDHLGIRLTDAAALVEAQSRLESAGWQTQREEGVECCYSRQTKFWVADPDGVLWEFYILHDEEEHEPPPASAIAAMDPPRESTAPQTLGWQHLLVQPLPERIEHADDSLDHVQLEGTLNLDLEPSALEQFLGEVRRVLRPGGELGIRGLAADGAIAGPLPKLPGPAALVQYVPRVLEVIQALADAGFGNIEITKLGEAACFKAGCVDLREMRITAVKRGPAQDTPAGWVLYRGPLSSVTDDEGRIYPRGERLAVAKTAWESLRSGSAAGQFAFFPAAATAACCG